MAYAAGLDQVLQEALKLKRKKRRARRARELATVVVEPPAARGECGRCHRKGVELYFTPIGLRCEFCTR